MLRRLATSRDRVVRRPCGRRGAGGGTRRLLLLALRVCAERCGHRDAGLHGLVEIAERELEGAEERDDVLQRDEAEMRDPNQLAFHLSLAAGHDGVVVVAEDADEIPRVDAGRWPERGHRRGGVALVGEELEVHRLQTATRRACQVAMATDDRLETFLGHESERLLERDEYRDGGRRPRLRLLQPSLAGGGGAIRLRQVRPLLCPPGARAHPYDRYA